jgi:CopA family copper-resistance protein
MKPLIRQVLSIFRSVAKHAVRSLLLLASLVSVSVTAEEYQLDIREGIVNLTGKDLNRITINGGIPGPTLEFTEGEDAVIHVSNYLNRDSSVHWHGLLLPGYMDGVPGLNEYPGIKPGETFTYRFPLRQSGTYWYHAHSGGQEQDGHYGSIIVHPKKPRYTVDKDYVVLLSDFHEDSADTIMANLKTSSEYYVYARRTLGDFWRDAREHGFRQAWKNSAMWADMRMRSTDIADINNYTYLMNGKPPEGNWTGLFNAGESVRLRFINASAMSFFDIRIPGMKLKVIEADGQPVEPVIVDEFRMGVAETYDVIVTPKRNVAYTIAAEPIDRMGFAIGTLAPSLGMKGPAPKKRVLNELTMADMGMAHDGHDMSGMTMDHRAHTKSMNHEGMSHEGMNHENMDHTKVNHDSMNDSSLKGRGATYGSGHTTGHDPDEMPEGTADDVVDDYDTGVPGSGWANAGTPAGRKALAYSDLRYLGKQTDLREPEREILVTLGGTMERYIWTLNGKKYADADPIQLAYGERVRLTFVNETMMAHPMHLHGMFVQLENGQPMEKLPNKHTVIVAPGDKYSVLLTADEPGEWAFHCHLLYHMMSGMMNEVVVAKYDGEGTPSNMNHDEKHSMEAHEH